MPDPLETARIRQARGKFAAMAASYFLGTFNDNFYKQGVLLLAVAANRTSFQGLAAAAYTLPFVLFAAPAGWAADRYSKRSVVIASKLMELGAALVGAAGLLFANLWLMVGMVGLMGIQATFFSPALNGAIPELYPASYVTKANGVLRMLVTVAILVGTACSGVVLDLQGRSFLRAGFGSAVLAGGVIGVAALGLAVSLGIPFRPAADERRVFPWSGPLETVRELRSVFQDRLLGTIVWSDVFIWSAGALQLLLINPLGLVQFHLSKQLTSGLVASQMIGIGVGGLLAARWAQGDRWYRVLVPGCLAMAAFLGAMAAVPCLPVPVQVPALFPLLALVGASGGLVMIPCESFIQVRPAPERKGAVWASANGIVFTGIVVASLVSNALNLWLAPSASFGVLAAGALGFAAWLRARIRREGRP
ncbi:MAG TPA: MFS transporter [Holophaga sp.]|nr:MFS transporter [Holophaga sp.]